MGSVELVLSVNLLNLLRIFYLLFDNFLWVRVVRARSRPPRLFTGFSQSYRRTGEEYLLTKFALDDRLHQREPRIFIYFIFHLRTPPFSLLIFVFVMVFWTSYRLNPRILAYLLRLELTGRLLTIPMIFNIFTIHRHDHRCRHIYIYLHSSHTDMAKISEIQIIPNPLRSSFAQRRSKCHVPRLGRASNVLRQRLADHPCQTPQCSRTSPLPGIATSLKPPITSRSKM